MSKETLVIIIQESVLKSVIKDVGTFSMFAGLMWFNHQYLAGSTFIDFLFIVCVILFLISRNSSSVFKGKPKDAIKYLADKEQL